MSWIPCPSTGDALVQSCWRVGVARRKCNLGVRKVAGRQVDREKEAIAGIMGVLRVDSIIMHYCKLFSPLIISSSNFRDGFRTLKKKDVVNFHRVVLSN